ncbi:DUF4262 domain-containing protein [Streptomyces clavuligerus]|uniref:DUF4262 domain-containing protein n=1 Tax=Streptomyces clavuligerus TaxID=1901 RepID=UPI00020D919D|nr:DUF4262 domain-containing protein [Streptomyces clavuligerus]WDN55867.1 DUF4262 domain-containing protein [Streptomyces clavuligerus]
MVEIIRMRFLGHPWERVSVAAGAGGREELLIALFLRAMETVPELCALPDDPEAYAVRWDGEELSVQHPDVAEQAVFRAGPGPECSGQGGAPVKALPCELWREERGHGFYPAPEELAEVPGLWATVLEPHEHQVVRLRYVSSWGEWYIVEVDSASGAAYGWSCLGRDRSQGSWGRIDLLALESFCADGDLSQLVVRDLEFAPGVAADVLPEGRPLWGCENSDCPICLPGFMAECVSRMRKLIEEHGFAVQAVSADESSAAYCYTVGLHKSLGVELVMGGLEIGAMHDILRTVAERLAGSSGPIVSGVLEGLLPSGCELLMRPVNSLESFAMFRAVYGREAEVPYWQAVWPDRDGCFPTDSACSLSPRAQLLF